MSMNRPSYEHAIISDLILWCRENGIAWTRLAYGQWSIEGVDTRLAPPEDAKPQPGPPRPNIREQYGPPHDVVAAADARQTALVDEG
jgi:hypothetical protein